MIFLPRIEYVRHNLIAGGNYLTQSKFQLIKIYLFYHMTHLFSFSLAYVLSKAIVSYGLNQILNLFVAFNLFITVKVYEYFLGSPL